MEETPDAQSAIIHSSKQCHIELDLGIVPWDPLLTSAPPRWPGSWGGGCCVATEHSQDS